MLVSLSGRALACALVLGFGSVLSATAKEDTSPPAEPAVVDLFAGIDDGRVEATVVPRDSKKVTLQLRNKSDQPVTIRLPEAFAAVPVQAQFGGGMFGGGAGGLFGGRGMGPGGGNPFGAGQGGGTQGLGVAGQNGGQNGVNGGRRKGGGPGLFSVPAGKVVKVKLTSVCLEYGKPEPHARNEYVVRPIEALCGKAEVVSIIRSLGDGEVSQEVAQLAAWNVASGTGFEEMASLKSKFGLQLPVYSQDTISAAAEFVRGVNAQATAEAGGVAATASVSANP